MKPIRLQYQPLPHFYRGRVRLANFRGLAAPPGERYPEEWLGAALARSGEHSAGISRVDNQRLDELVAADPESQIGPGKVGGAPILVKLLDASERLPVHVHPDRSFVKWHLGGAHDKAEAWLIVETPVGGGEVLVGFRRNISADTLRRWVAKQSRDRMLAALNRVIVQPGDTVYVPPGISHAIGIGILLLEVQEPSDHSIMLEWSGFAIDGPSSALLGLERDIALAAAPKVQ